MTYDRWELQGPAKAAAESAENQRDQEQHQGDEEHDFRDSYSCARNPAESENACDQSNDEQGDDQT